MSVTKNKSRAPPTPLYISIRVVWTHFSGFGVKIFMKKLKFLSHLYCINNEAEMSYDRIGFKFQISQYNSCELEALGLTFLIYKMGVMIEFHAKSSCKAGYDQISHSWDIQAQ